MVKRKKNHLWSRGPGIEWKEEAVPGYAPAAVGSAKIGARVGEKVEPIQTPLLPAKSRPALLSSGFCPAGI